MLQPCECGGRREWDHALVKTMYPGIARAVCTACTKATPCYQGIASDECFDDRSACIEADDKHKVQCGDCGATFWPKPATGSCPNCGAKPNETAATP